MSTRIWRLAGISLLSLSISAQILADDNNSRDSNRDNSNRAHQQQQQQQLQQRQQQQFQQRQQQQGQHEVYQQQREQQQQNQERFNQQRGQQERQQQQRQQQQDQQDRQQQQRQEQQQQQQRLNQERQQERQNNLPIQGRPDQIRQSQPPRQSGFQDNRTNQNQAYRGGNDRRPEYGHGNGWGSGPRYRPGYEIDRMPGGYSRVPYRGQDYFYSGGYWYRPQGPRYIVVEPPRGVRVRYLPDYTQQVWMGSALFFLAAGTYYTYEQSTQEYIVAQPPQNVEPVYSPTQMPAQIPQQQQQGDPYDVPAYPANGQGPEQVQQDRYDCFNYAVSQSNFNPSTATYAPAPEVLNLYQQAMAGCLVSRGYTVN
jgi:hypothetical protein